jgi:hypothetical protein
MNAIISFDTIVGLLANPPCLDPRPNFFNLHALQTHFAWALKKVPCPQSAVNGWAGGVLAPAMYALINTTAFHWNISPQSTVPVFLARFVTQADGTQGALLPYSCKKILTISAKHTLNKNYYETGVNVCRDCFDILNAHVSNAYKAAPAGSTSTIGWNSTMLPNKIFEQLMTTYGKPTPDAMRQNNLTFISAHNSKDPPKLLFKRCADCQDIAIIVKIPSMSKQLLMKVMGAPASTCATWMIGSANQTLTRRMSTSAHLYKPCISTASHQT